MQAAKVDEVVTETTARSLKEVWPLSSWCHEGSRSLNRHGVTGSLECRIAEKRQNDECG